MDKLEFVHVFRFVTYSFTCPCGQTYRLPVDPWRLTKEEDHIRCSCGRIWTFSVLAHTDRTEHLSDWVAINRATVENQS